jgi:hypothetical protein
MKLSLLWDERRWVLIALLYLSAWWFPLSLFWGLQNPGMARPEGIDGPLSWLWKNYWGVTWSPISFQSLVPLGVIALIWSRRDDARSTLKKPGKTTSWLFVGGCIALALAHLIHLPSLATAALIAIAAGIVTMVYGRAMLKALRAPFLFWLTMIPPPESLASIAMKLVGPLSVQLAALPLKLVGKNVLARPPQLILDGIPMEAGGIGTEGSAGVAAMSGAAAALLCWGLYRRWPFLRVLMLVILGVFLALLFNLLRIDLALLLRGSNRGASQWVLQANSWLLSLPATGLSLWLDARAGRLASTSTGRLGRLLAHGWKLSGKGADQALERSEKVARGAAIGIGRLVRVLTAPFVYVLDLTSHAVVRLFRLLASSNAALERRFNAADRARRRKKRGGSR